MNNFRRYSIQAGTTTFTYALHGRAATLGSSSDMAFSFATFFIFVRVSVGILHMSRSDTIL